MLRDNAHLLLSREAQLVGMTEVQRSFEYLLNVGNYESRRFFCSQRAECKPADAEAVSEKLHAFCKSQVMKSVNDYLAVERARQAAIEKRRAS